MIAEVKIWLVDHRTQFATAGFWLFWGLVALAVRVFLFQPFNIPSTSMLPTLRVGDHLFVSKYAYGYSRYALPFQSGPVSGRVFARDPQRGDVIVFRLPSDDSQDYIKRVIGLPGDSVRTENGELFINDKLIPRTFLGNYVWREYLPDSPAHDMLDLVNGSVGDHSGTFHVPQEHIFVMGDNRDNSADSRFATIVGFVPMNNIVGRAEIIYFSIEQSASWWQLWLWPQSIRWRRIGKLIQ